MEYLTRLQELEREYKELSEQYRAGSAPEDLERLEEALKLLDKIEVEKEKAAAVEKERADFINSLSPGRRDILEEIEKQDIARAALVEKERNLEEARRERFIEEDKEKRRLIRTKIFLRHMKNRMGERVYSDEVLDAMSDYELSALYTDITSKLTEEQIKNIFNPTVNLEEEKALEKSNAADALRRDRIIQQLRLMLKREPSEKEIEEAFKWKEPEARETHKEMTEEAFKAKLDEIVKYIKKMHDREPGWNYDNLKEYEDMLANMNRLGIKDPEVAAKMKILADDIVTARSLKDNPIRTPEEEAFYKKLVGINSFVHEQKDKDPNYLYDNIAEANSLLSELEKIKSKDPDTLNIMDYLMKDIKKVIEKDKGKDEAKKFQDRLDSLNIGPKVTPEEIKKAAAETDKPETKGIKEVRDLNEAEKNNANLADQKERKKKKYWQAYATIAVIGGLAAVLFVPSIAPFSLAPITALIATQVAAFPLAWITRKLAESKPVQAVRNMYKNFQRWMDEGLVKTGNKIAAKASDSLEKHSEMPAAKVEERKEKPSLIQNIKDGYESNSRRLMEKLAAKRAEMEGRSEVDYPTGANVVRFDTEDPILGTEAVGRSK